MRARARERRLLYVIRRMTLQTRWLKRHLFLMVQRLDALDSQGVTPESPWPRIEVPREFRGEIESDEPGEE